MLARLASVLRGTRATVTMRPAWATARSMPALRSTPALRSFCTEPPLKPHVHVSAIKAESMLFDASYSIAHAVRSMRLWVGWPVRSTEVPLLPARSLMWHVGQASHEGDVSKTKQLLRRLKDEAVLKEAVEGAKHKGMVKGNRLKFLFELAFLNTILWVGFSVVTACCEPQSPVVPYIKDSFFLLYYATMLEFGLSSDYERLEILGKQLEYKYPKGKTLTDEEARELAKEQIEAVAREYGSLCVPILQR